MPLIDRVKAIILSPKTEWPVIAAETGDIGSIYKNYLIYLAAIAPIAMFLGLSVFGMSIGPVTIRQGFFSGLMQGVVTFVLALVMFYVIALIVDALAPTFKGEKNLNNAFKLVAYGSTAAMVAGILYLIPALSILVLLASLYSLYTLYIGLPVLMKCPPGKALPYTAVLIVCGIVAGIVFAMLSSCFRPSPGPLGADAGGAISIKTPQGEVTIDKSKIEAATKKLQEASKQVEASSQKVTEAAKSADPAQAGKALAEALGAMAAAVGGREPVSANVLKDLMPESIGDLKRESFETKDAAAMGIKGSMAEAEYGSGDRKIELRIADAGGLAGLMSLAGWANITGEKDNKNESEKVYKQGSRTVREHINKGNKEVEYSLILGNGVMIEAEGRGTDIAALKKIIEALPLAKLEAIGAK